MILAVWSLLAATGPGIAPSWTEVALQALNVAQTVLLAYLTMGVRRNRAQLEDIQRRSHRVRRTDHPSLG